MRTTFVNTLLDLAKANPQVILLTGDLGFMVLEPFAAQLPERFINVGVAEQNMVGIATGLAEAGFIPFVYSIVNFSVLRPYEFIRNGPILHNLPVRIVGVGGGLEYSSNGATHYGLEDIGVLRVQQGIQVIAPADAQQTRSALLATWNQPGPVYYRLGKDDKRSVPGLNGRFSGEDAEIVREGDDVLFLTVGNITFEALEAADLLTSQNIESTVAVVPSLNPGPQEFLCKLLSRFSLVLTVEAHFINGGLGSLVAEVIAENNIPVRLIRCGLHAAPDGVSGSQKFLYRKYGISGDKLAEVALKEVKSRQGIR